MNKSSAQSAPESRTKVGTTQGIDRGRAQKTETCSVNHLRKSPKHMVSGEVGWLPRPVRPQCPPPPSHRPATNSPTQPPTRRRRPHQHPDELDGPAQTGCSISTSASVPSAVASEGDCHCDRAQCHRSDPRSLASARPRNRRTTRATPAPARMTRVPGPKTLADLGDDARVLNRSVRLTLAPCRPRAHPL